MITEQEHEAIYERRGQIERLSELGTDLMNLVDKEQWELTYKFTQSYFAFYSGRKPIFGVNLQNHRPRLCVWLEEWVVVDREDDGETDSRHERYYNWFHSIGFAAYPTDVEVADIENLLRFTYSYRTDPNY